MDEQPKSKKGISKDKSERSKLELIVVER